MILKSHHQISGTDIETKFAPPYEYLFTYRMKNDFLESEIAKLWLWLKFKNDIFFIWIKGEYKLGRFLNRFDNFHPNLKFTHEKSKSSVNFLDVSAIIVDNKSETGLYCKC